MKNATNKVLNSLRDFWAYIQLKFQSLLDMAKSQYQKANSAIYSYNETARLNYGMKLM